MLGPQGYAECFVMRPELRVMLYANRQERDTRKLWCFAILKLLRVKIVK